MPQVVLDRPPLEDGCPGPWHIEECLENVDDRFGCLRLRSSYFQRPPEIFGWPIRDYRPRDRWTYSIYPLRELRCREVVGGKGAEPREMRRCRPRPANCAMPDEVDVSSDSRAVEKTRRAAE